MKKIRSIAIAFLVFLGAKSTIAQSTFKTPVSYMEFINKEMNAIMVDTWDYISAMSHGKNGRKVESKRKEVVRQTNVARQKISKMKDYEGDTSFRDSVLSYLNMSYNILNHDYEKIVNMEEVAEQSYDLMEAYLLAQEKSNERLDRAGDMMEAAQYAFAAKNNINLLENKDKVAKKLEKADKVMKHYHEVYLIFFKSFKQEAYLLDAISRSDVNAIEQNRNALIATSTEGLEKLKTIEPFKGDNSIKNSCNAALTYFKNEASIKMKDISDFYLKKENFEKARKAFEAKKNQSKQDVDEINKMGAEFNTALNKYNNTNQDMNKQRNAVIEKWNNSVTSFMDKNVPKYK